MQFSEELVNQVVANVLSTLSRQGQVAQHAGTASPDASVVLTEKVITADLLSAKVKGQTSVGIAAGAILTPTAKDYIRQNQISVHRPSTVAVSTRQGTKWRAIVLTPSSAVENALTDIEQQTGSRCERCDQQPVSCRCCRSRPVCLRGRKGSLPGQSKSEGPCGSSTGRQSLKRCNLANGA